MYSTNKKMVAFITILLLGVVFVSYAAVPNSTPADTIQTYTNGTSVGRFDYVVVDEDYFWYFNDTYYNVTEALENLLSINSTNEWGLVYGCTGDWFDYTEITYTPVYLGLQMHPLNLTYDSELVIPEVYDKDATHWQLALYWHNGTQITDDIDMLVMYYAHVEWDNVDGLEYLEPNGEPE